MRTSRHSQDWLSLLPEVLSSWLLCKGSPNCLRSSFLCLAFFLFAVPVIDISCNLHMFCLLLSLHRRPDAVSLLCPLLDLWAPLCPFASISTFWANPDLLLNRLKPAPETDYSISPEHHWLSLAKICIQIKNVAVIITSGCRMIWFATAFFHCHGVIRVGPAS